MASAWVGTPKDVYDSMMTYYDAIGGFDPIFWKAGDDVCEFFSSLRKQGVKVYIEPRLTAKQAQAGLGKYVDGTISEHRVDQMYKPDFAIQPGETIVDTGDLPTAQVQIPAGLTPCYRGPLNWNEPLSQ